MVKNLSAGAGDIRDVGLIPGSGKSPGGGHGHPLQYSCLENSMDIGAWWATVHRVAKSRTRLKRLGTHRGIYSSQKKALNLGRLKKKLVVTSAAFKEFTMYREGLETQQLAFRKPEG